MTTQQIITDAELISETLVRYHIGNVAQIYDQSINSFRVDGKSKKRFEMEIQAGLSDNEIKAVIFEKVKQDGIEVINTNFKVI